MTAKDIDIIVKDTKNWKPKGIVTTFQKISIGIPFEINGNKYVKTSSRTAYSIKFHKTFYFSSKDLVKL